MLRANSYHAPDRLKALMPEWAIKNGKQRMLTTFTAAAAQARLSNNAAILRLFYMGQDYSNNAALQQLIMAVTYPQQVSKPQMSSQVLLQPTASCVTG